MSGRQVVGSTLAYATFVFVGVLIRHAVKIFFLGQFERKFGPTGTLWLGIIISAYIIPISAIGYAVPIFFIRSSSLPVSNWRPVTLAMTGALIIAVCEALGMMGRAAIFLPFRTMTNLYVVNLALGVAAGGLAIILRSIFDRRAA